MFQEDLIDLTSEEAKISDDRSPAISAETAAVNDRRAGYGMPETSVDRNQAIAAAMAAKNDRRARYGMPSVDRKQATAGSSLVTPADDVAIRGYERFGIPIRNPYAKSASLFSRQGPQGLKPTSRFGSGSCNVSRLPTAAASKILPDDLNAAPSSPQTILEKLRPHPPTPEITEQVSGETAVVSPRAVNQDALPQVLDDTDNISTLSNDKVDDEGLFASNQKAKEDTDEASDGQVDSLYKRGMAFLLGLGKGGSNWLVHVMLMLRALSISFFDAGKTIGGSDDIASTEDINTHSNDANDDERPNASSQEVGMDSVPSETLGGKALSSTADILHKSGMIFRFCLYKGCSILFFCVMTMMLALGFSTCLGVIMGYLILLGKIDVPAVNDILKARFAQ